MSEDLEPIFEKIKKLLALANNNENENEAAVALEKASKLLAEHNLSLIDVTGRPADEDVVEITVTAALMRQKWANYLWTATAELNFCFYYRTPGRTTGDHHHLIGTQANVRSVSTMVNYLIDTIERLSWHAVSGHERPAYKLGCAQRVAVRLRTLKLDRAKGAAPSTGGNLPALADLYKVHDSINQDYFNCNHNFKLTFTSGSTTKNRAAYNKGYADGATIGLDTQISGHKAKTLR